jgi:hypothetical protein
VIDRILDLVNERWEVWLGDMPKPTDFSVLLQSRSRVSVFLFAQGAQAPLLVAKISRDSHDAQDVRHEWETVTRVRNALNGPLRDTLPQPLCLESVGGRTVMVETFMPGQVMPLHVGRGKMRHYHTRLQALYRWLEAFQAQTAHPIPPCLSPPAVPGPAPWPCRATAGGPGGTGRHPPQNIKGVPASRPLADDSRHAVRSR